MTNEAPPGTNAVATSASRVKTNVMWLAAKTAVSVGLIVVVFWKLNLAAVWEKSRQLSVALILAVILIFAVQTCVAAWRWWVILRHHHLGIRLLTTVRISLIGAFFNQLLPSSIGGDVARAWYVYRLGCSKSASVITVLSDRIYGMLLLAFLAIIFFPILVFFRVRIEALVVVGVVTSGATVALFAAFWLDRLPRWLQRWPVILHLGSLSEATRAITSDKRAIVPVLGLSLLVHAFTILATLVLLAAVAPQHNLLLCAALVPVITLMSTMPVSIAGWGVRESVMIYGLALAGIPKEAALIVSVLIGLSLAAVGLIGGVTWLLQNSLDKPHRAPV